MKRKKKCEYTCFHGIAGAHTHQNANGAYALEEEFELFYTVVTFGIVWISSTVNITCIIRKQF